MGYVIGLCGLPGAGKTEVRNILVKKHNFEPICSKSILYDMAALVTGLPPTHFSDPLFKNGEFNGIPLRTIAANCGFVMEDLFGEGYLINKSLVNHKVKERPNKNFVVDSLRMKQPIIFENEMIIIEISNYKTGKKTFPVYDQYYTPKSILVINNDTTKEELEKNVYATVRRIEDIRAMEGKY